MSEQEKFIEAALNALDKSRSDKEKRREDARSIRNEARDNARGKLKIKSRTSGPLGRALNHKKPRGCSFINPRYRFRNPMAWLGYSDDEYREYEKTGKTKEEGN